MTDVAIEVLHRVLSHVIHGPREQVGVGDDQVSAFLETLKKGLCHYFLPSFLALGIGIYLCLFYCNCPLPSLRICSLNIKKKIACLSKYEMISTEEEFVAP